MAHWIRFDNAGETGFGTLTAEQISVYEGDMFNQPTATGETLSLSDVTLLIPCVPTKMLALWNNLKAQSTKLEFPTPANPWYFIKTANTFIASGETIRRPKHHDGKVVFEAELGIVVGKQCSGVSEDEADDAIFGYTCVNDVTAVQALRNDPFFEEWTRAKCFDTFGPFGPCIATDLDPENLVIRGILNGTEFQNYPANDMLFSPRQLVSLISHDMTLMPGDVISCGTSLGAKVMRDPTNTIEIAVDGIGSLINTYE